MKIITTRNDLHTYLADTRSDLVALGSEYVEAVLGQIAHSDHPAWGSDWAEWLDAELDGLITATVDGLDARALAAEWGESAHESEAIELVKAGAYTTTTHWATLVAEYGADRIVDMSGRPSIPLRRNPAGGIDCYICLEPDRKVWWHGDGVSVALDSELTLDEIMADANEDDVTLEEMPDHLRSSHRAAGNWGSYPHNGATRRRCSREEAEEIVAADEDEYDHIVEDA